MLMCVFFGWEFCSGDKLNSCMVLYIWIIIRKKSFFVELEYIFSVYLMGFVISV